MSIIIPANTLASGDFEVDNSCRFDDGSSAYMHITPDSDGSRVAWTFSTWIKRCALGAMPIFSTPGNTSNIYDEFYFNASDKIQFSAVVSGTQYALRTKRVFRDTSAWYHIVLIFDSNNSTAGNRMQLWINGVRTAEGDFEDITFKDAQNYNSSTNKSGYIIYLGRVTTNTAGYYDGYMSEVVFQNAAVDSPVDKFGEFDEDSGIWKPIDVSGLTFGTNGFYLDFKASGNLGNDANGGTDLTEVNLAATDQSTDTCTNNFATLNPLIYESRDNTFAEGNLKITGGGSDDWVNKYGVSNFAVSSGKWFVEAKMTTVVGSQGMLGIMGTSTALVGSMKDNGPANIDAGGRITGGGNNIQTGLTNFANGNIAGAAFDATNGTIQFYRNGSAYGNAVSSIASDTYYFVTNSYDAGAVVEFNFGSPPYSESGGNSDGDGFGNFSMAVPSGYFALNTKNLAEYG